MVELFLPVNSNAGEETAFTYFYIHWKEQPEPGISNSMIAKTEGFQPYHIDSTYCKTK